MTLRRRFNHLFGPRDGICFRSNARRALLLLALSLVYLSSARAQLDLTRVYGAEDADVPSPPIHVTLGRQDAGALQELIDYLKAVNVGPWQGLKGTGSFTNGPIGAGSAEQASLAIAQGDKFRLDVQTQRGLRSTRISGSYGNTVDPSGSNWALPRATARLGLVFFPQLLSATFPAPRTSLIDQGQVQIEARNFHRITVSEPLADDQQATTDPTRFSIVDLYFDTTSHLLVRSVAAIQLDSADHARYIQVLTYSDYRKVENSLMAFRFHQSLNGQSQWTLQLNSVELAPDTNSSDFYF